MKVIAIVPVAYTNPKVLVELTAGEWKRLISGAYHGNNSSGKTIAPIPGDVHDIHARFESVMSLESAVEKAEKTPTTLRGMADALESVVTAAKKSFTPVETEEVNITNPNK